MIRKYQRLDIILNHMVDIGKEIPAQGLYLRSALEHYFVRYVPSLTGELHKLSKVNIDYILSLQNRFTDEELRFIGKIGEFSEEPLPDK